MQRLHFETTIEILGINPYVLVTSEQANALQIGWKKPMPVKVQVNGKPDEPWKINMMPMGAKGGGAFYLYLSVEVRTASKTKVGDVVTVDVWFDEEYRDGPGQFMPEWFQTALHADLQAMGAWNKLPPSRQKEVARYLGGLKSDDARQRNLQKVLHVLNGNEDRLMGRDWKDGK